MSQQFYHIDRFRPLSLEALCLHLPHVLLYRPTSLPGWKGPRSDWNFNGLSTQSRPDWSCYRKSCPTADPPTYQSGPLSSFTGRTRSRRLESYKVNLIRSLVNLHTAFASMLNIVAAHVYLSVVSESSQIWHAQDTLHFQILWLCCQLHESLKIWNSELLP